MEKKAPVRVQGYDTRMARANPALVNPALLQWARQESGWTVEPVAKRLHVKPERLTDWERGDAKPTIRQARQLAAFYRRPLGVFYLPQPPTIPPLGANYRRLPGVTPGVESPEFRLAVRTLLQRRDEVLELSDELDVAWPAFDVASRLSEGPGAVGAKLRSALGVTNEEQAGWRADWEGWRRWRGAIEGAGVLVLQFPKVALTQIRGVSLLKSPLQVIGVNSKESSPGARSYTLLHELVHISLALGREEATAIDERRDDPAWERVERFAEEAASAALIPEDMLRERLAGFIVGNDRWDIDNMRQLAAHFRVTPLAMATRLRAASVISWGAYRTWKEAWLAHVSRLPVRKGFAAPVDKTLGRCGRPLAQLVVQALDLNRITAVQASRYLDLRFDHFEKLRERLFRRPPRDRAFHDEGD